MKVLKKVLFAVLGLVLTLFCIGALLSPRAPVLQT